MKDFSRRDTRVDFSLSRVREYQAPKLDPVLIEDRVRAALQSDRLELEIGCGVGLHPILFGKEFPNTTLIAIEHTREKFLKFERRLARHPELKNIFGVHANAIAFVNQHVKKESVDRLWLLYPNPNPKSADLNRRWHAMPFAEQLIASLKPGAELVTATNLEWYAQEAQEFWTRCWGLKLVSQIQMDSGSVARTHFEKKYLERGERCWNLVFKRSE
jgi:tRNA (guanine-N7-)-methyltransferase